jgi:hypothetical protein
MTKGVFLYGLYLASTVAHYVLEIVETDYQSSGKLSTHHIPPHCIPSNMSLSISPQSSFT